MSVEDDDLEAAILFPQVAHAMAELVKKCHYPLGQFARLESERLRHQERANKEAVINCELNADMEAMRLAIGNAIHYLENESAYSGHRKIEILECLRELLRKTEANK